jgi:hypothetical protein
MDVDEAGRLDNMSGPESEEGAQPDQVSVTLIRCRHMLICIPVQNSSMSTSFLHDVGMSESHSVTPSIQEVPPVINTLSLPSSVDQPAWYSQVPSELEERLDEAMSVIDGLVSDLVEIRLQLNALNDRLHTTMLTLKHVHQKIGRD